MRGPGYFFFYGTLRGDCGNAFAQTMLSKLDYIGPAWTEGRIFAITGENGAYPVLLQDAKTKGARVRGACYRMAPAFGAADLARLDAYEAYFPGARARSEYLRKIVGIKLASGRRARAWCYVYDRTIPRGAEEIASGDFAAYLRRRGKAPYADRPDLTSR